MNRVKKIEEVIIGEAEVLVEVCEPKRQSDIILSDESMSDSQSTAYGIVLAKGSSVVDLEIGDIVLKTRVKSAPAFKYNGKELAIYNRYNIAIAIKPSNFNNTEKSEITS